MAGEYQTSSFCPLRLHAELFHLGSQRDKTWELMTLKKSKRLVYLMSPIGGSANPFASGKDTVVSDLLGDTYDNDLRRSNLVRQSPGAEDVVTAIGRIKYLYRRAV